jgi:aryl-alcohol dehydrogenase-like predicted oxidoreductase
VVIATKVYARVGPGRNDVGASRGHIMDAVDASLRRLQTDYIDLYQIHGNDTITPVEETLRALDTLVTAGKARASGSFSSSPAREYGSSNHRRGSTPPDRSFRWERSFDTTGRTRDRFDSSRY